MLVWTTDGRDLPLQKGTGLHGHALRREALEAMRKGISDEAPYFEKADAAVTLKPVIMIVSAIKAGKMQAFQSLSPR